ncbi:MAG TPA: 23S rRNA (guanosine(2251)-2'-O)-methyltransferase RlmB [Phaeodactylibacter sp.]|nr:23S rRNA (guanosine(2251)-2'-O)-methyltransferase RlmB [Phaeodactylibacter sp.]
MQFKKKSLIIGKHPVIDAIQTGTSFDKIFLQQGTRGEFEKELRHLTKQFNIPVQIVPREKMNRLSSANHQGVVGLIALIPFYKLEDLLPTIYEKSETPLILVLDGVTDIRNIGAIARTAECSGVHAIVIQKKGAAQINAEAIKSSAGALTKIPICREQSLSGAIDILEMSGISIFASSLGAKKMVFDCDFTQPTAIVMGSEGRGVHREILKRIDNQFIIPQKGTTDSFNVSVATGMILYEITRQRF